MAHFASLIPEEEDDLEAPEEYFRSRFVEKIRTSYCVSKPRMQQNCSERTNLRTSCKCFRQEHTHMTVPTGLLGLMQHE
jgi:hypothetical protein